MKAENQEMDCLCEDRVEPKGSKEVRSIVSRESMEKGGAEDLLTKVLDRENLNKAYKRVKRNGGAAGIDGMTVEEMLPYLRTHKVELVEQIRSGKYKPQPVRRVEIPKPDGGKRLLGVPTVIDRMIQQALVQVLQPIFDPTFSENSYGYRPGRCAQQAMKKAVKYYDEGYTRMVDIDLSKYFDTMNHELLMEMVREKIQDKAGLNLIKKFLKSGVMVNGVKCETEDGSPQGGPLSPLLSNLYLDVFDKEMEARGHKFLRYADDIAIYVKTDRAAGRVLESTTEFLEGKLKLQVNRVKSGTGSPLRLKYLGFSLFRTGKGTGIRVHQKPMKKFKEKVRAITKRNRGRAVSQILKELKFYVYGWLNYYAIAGMSAKAKALDQWTRRHVRQYIWKQWKKVKTRFANLQKLGISKEQSWEWANTRKGYWRCAGSFLHRALTDKYLVFIGYASIAERYEALHLSY